MSGPALSNYLVQRSPDFYGGKQAEYQALSEEAIQKGVHMMRAEKGDLTKLFFDVLDHFRKARRAIAEKHTPDKAHLFGIPRNQSRGGECWMVTGLHSNYEEYNRVFMDQFKKIIGSMKHDLKGFQEKRKAVEENVLGRAVRFEVEILEQSDVAELQSKTPESEIQDILETKKSLLDIQHDYELMKKLKQKRPDLYQNLFKLSIFTQINTDFPSPKVISYERGECEGNQDHLKNLFAICTLRYEINGKAYAISKYATWLYTNFRDDSVERMAGCSKTLIVHHDVYLIEETLQEVAKLFAKAVSWNKESESVQELKNRTALFRFLYSHCMPSPRGDGAIGDWFELATYRYHGFEGTRYNQRRLPCFETLSSISLSRYMKEYDKVITVSDVNLNELRQQMGTFVANRAKEIAADFHRRESSSDKKSILGGCWYPNSYYDALKKHGQNSRLEFLKARHAFYHGYPNTKETGFELIPCLEKTTVTGKYLVKYRLARGRLASEAIQSLPNRLMLIDGAQLCQLSQYQALLEVLGKERFDKLFSSDPKHLMIVSDYYHLAEQNPLMVFLTSPIERLAVGQRVAFANAPSYSLKHINGEFPAINALCIDATPGAERFLALDTPHEGLSKEGIQAHLVEEYNKTPVDFSIFTDELADKIRNSYKRQELEANRQFKHLEISAKDLPDLDSKNSGFDFDMNVVYHAKETPIEELSIDFLWDKKGYRLAKPKAK